MAVGLSIVFHNIITISVTNFDQHIMTITLASASVSRLHSTLLTHINKGKMVIEVSDIADLILYILIKFIISNQPMSIRIK